MGYILDFTDEAKQDIKDLQKSDSAELMEHPTEGTGKPKPMKYGFAGLFTKLKTIL